jgi:pantoate--beta-alanine ligase
MRLDLGKPPESRRESFAHCIPRHWTHVAPRRPQGQVARMEVARTIGELRAGCEALRRRSATLALVPTMGALHDGHRALVREAGTGGSAVVTSIFVNPLQFAASEDLSRYPRDEAGDLAILEAAGCHLVWLPDVAVMYPPGDATTIDAAGPAELWEGAARRGHFRGVATVCAKLFGQVRPDRAYFGEKDWQQLQVVRRMVTDLHLPLDIAGVPTVREPDGLALSSRNRFLTAAHRAVAPRLFAVLQAAAQELATGPQAAGPLHSAHSALETAGFLVDYVALVDGPTLQPLATWHDPSRLIAAARLGSVRLLDNVAV